MPTTAPVPVHTIPGCNGTNGPPDTPWHLDTVANGGVDAVLEMKPSGSSLGVLTYTNDDFVKAHASANAAAPGNKRAIVLMAPGNIVGKGGGSTAQPALQNVGVTRANNILFYPRDGVGTVVVTGDSAQYRGMKSMVLAGVRGGSNDQYAQNIAAAESFFLWRCTGAVFNAVSIAGTKMKTFGWYECIIPNIHSANSDSMGIRTPSNAPMEDVHIVHCEIEASYRLAGSDTHTDSIQFSGSSSIGPVKIIGNKIVVSTNQGIIFAGAVYGLTQAYNVIIGGLMNKVYSPPPAGSGPVGDGCWPVNGAPTAGTVLDHETWIGDAKGIFASLVGVTASLTGSQSTKDNTPAVARAGWTVDSSLNYLTQAQLFARWPKRSALQVITAWNVGGNTPAPPPPVPGDSTAPTGVWAIPTMDNAEVSGNAVVVAVDAFDSESGVGAVSFSVLGTKLGDGVKAGDRWTLAGIDSTKYPLGTYTVVATLSDVAGNVRTISRPVKIVASDPGVPPAPADTTKPVVSLDAPLTGSEVTGSVVFESTATDEKAMGHVELWGTWGGIERRIGDWFESIGGSAYRLQIEAPSLPDDITSARLRAVDAAGNEAWSNVIAITKRIPDAEPPVVVLRNPTPGFELSGESYDFEMSASDNREVVSAAFIDQDRNVISTAEKLDANDWRASGDLVDLVNVEAVRAVAYDLNGNVGESALIPVSFAAPPEALGWTRLVWSVDNLLVDGADEDEAPDVVPASGIVEATPMVGYVKAPGLEVPKTYIVKSARLVVKNGILYGPDGKVDVHIFSLYDSPNVTPTGAQWRLRFFMDGAEGVVEEVYVNAKSGETIDLSVAISEAQQAGTVAVVTHEDRLAAEEAAARSVAAMLQIESRLTAGNLYWVLDSDGTPFWFIAASAPIGSLKWELDADGTPYWTEINE